MTLANEKPFVMILRSIEPVNSDEITFHYDDTAPPENQPIVTTVDKVCLLNENQLATVEGILTLCTNSIREVIMKNGFVVPMLDRCTITDNSGTIPITLWADLIKQVANEKSYSITHIRVKQYKSKKYLTTTPSTTITSSDKHYSPPTNEFFDSLFDAKTILADRIRLADTFKTWLSCSKCQNMLPEAASASNTILKCLTAMHFNRRPLAIPVPPYGSPFETTIMSFCG